MQQSGRIEVGPSGRGTDWCSRQRVVDVDGNSRHRQQPERVAGLDYAGTQSVVEEHLAVFHDVGEVHVANAIPVHFFQVGQSDVVGRGEPTGFVFEQVLQNCARADVTRTCVQGPRVVELGCG